MMVMGGMEIMCTAPISHALRQAVSSDRVCGGRAFWTHIRVRLTFRRLDLDQKGEQSEEACRSSVGACSIGDEGNERLDCGCWKQRH